MATPGMTDGERASGFGHHYLPTDRPLASAGLEDDSEAAWAEFQRLARAQGPAAAARGAATLDQLLELATRDGRVCPLPPDWLRLYEMLPSAADAAQRPPAPPVRRTEWMSTSAVAKRMCLQVHLEWADRHGAMPQVARFLSQLAESQWHHAGDR